MKDFDVSKLTQESLNAHLCCSVEQDDGMVSFWLEAGADVNCRFLGNPLLLYVMENENEELATKLVELGADVNALDEFEDPILFRVLNGIKWLNILAKGNLDINVKNHKNENAFSVACMRDKEDVIDRLVELGIKLDESFVARSVPILHFIIYRRKYGWLDKLIELKADLNVIRKNNGYTALMEAVDNDDEVASIKLIKAGADVNLQSYDGSTALMFAKDYEIAESLVKNHAEINLVDNLGQTALINLLEMAEEDDDDTEKICELLLENGADVSVATLGGVTALELALDLGNEKIIELIKKYAKK